MARLRRDSAGHRELRAATERRRCRCLAALMVSKRSWKRWPLREGRLLRLRPARLQGTAPRFPTAQTTRTSHLSFGPSTRTASAMRWSSGSASKTPPRRAARLLHRLSIRASFRAGAPRGAASPRVRKASWRGPEHQPTGLAPTRPPPGASAAGCRWRGQERAPRGDGQGAHAARARRHGCHCVDRRCSVSYTHLTLPTTPYV